jgi:hypothetical protein
MAKLKRRVCTLEVLRVDGLSRHPRFQCQTRMNPPTRRPKGRAASPSTRAQAEGLMVHPERHFFTPPSKTELRAAEGVKIWIVSNGDQERFSAVESAIDW